MIFNPFSGSTEATAALVNDLITLGGGEIASLPPEGDEELVTLVDIKSGRKMPPRVPIFGLKPPRQYTWVFDSVSHLLIIPLGK